MTRSERARENFILCESYKYIADTRFNVFHKKNSKCLKKIPFDYWRGVGKAPAKHGYTPCPSCYGKMGYAKSPAALGRKTEAGLEIEQRLIDGNYTSSSKIIARCHSLAHRGYLSKGLVNSHDCLGKKCGSFEKLKSEYWMALEEAASAGRDRRAQIKEAKKITNDRDVFIRATLEDSGCIHVTSIRDEPNNLLYISYIYDRKTDLAPEIKFLRSALGKTIKLQAKIGSEEAIEKLIRKPRREMQKVTDVRKAPKVGNVAKKRLEALGIFCLEDLFGRDGDSIYDKDCELSGGTVSRRFLAAYRSAAEYANGQPMGS